jgi:hypothetical protein
MDYTDFITCFLLFIPVFIWNLILYKKLPEKFQKNIWDKIPKYVNTCENILRFITFFFPIFLKLEITNSFQIIGGFLYIIGIAVYFLSWIFQIKYPASKWSESIFGFMAPAYTTIIWLTGISLIGQKLIFDFPYIFILYLIFAVLFVFIHTFHSFYVFKNVESKT